MTIERAGRADWFVWRDPPAEWCREHAAVPGLQWSGDGQRVTAVHFHRSHAPVIGHAEPPDVDALTAAAAWARRLQADCGITLRPYQAEDLPFLVERKGALLAYEMRLGKQQPVDSKVLTPTGWREIGALRPGDLVIGSDGKPTRVLQVFPQGVKSSYRVRFSDGSSVEAGPEHLWTVLVRAGGRRWRELQLTTDQLRTRPPIQWTNARQEYTLDLAKAVLYLPLLSAPAVLDCESLPLPAYFVGQLIANGSLAHGTPSLSCHVDDWSSIAASFTAAGVSVGAVRSYGRVQRSGYPDISACIADLGLAVLSGEKRIPPSYLYSSVDDRIALLQGLLDGDGSISKQHNRVVFHTTSGGLATDVRVLVELLGGIASVRSYDRAVEGKPVEYQVRIRTPVGVDPFRVPRKRDRYTPGAHAYPTRTVRAVEYVRDVESVCIAVAAADRLYATEHCILTHNTVPSCAAHSPTDGPLVVVAPLAGREVWREWIERVHGEPPWILQGRTVERPPVDAGAYFVHYDILEAWTELFAGGKIGTLIIDEAHYLQNRRARRTNAMHVLTNRVERVIALTGTPMWTNPDSMYAILHLINPGAWGTHFDFAKRYAGAMPGAHGWTYKGASNADELRARLQEIMIRRAWADVAPDLPPTTYAIEPVPIAPAELAKLEALAVQAGLIAHTTTAAGYLATLRRKLADVKVVPAIESARRAMLDGHKVVVWVWHNEIGDKIAAGLQAPGKKTAGKDIVPGFPTVRLKAEDSGDLRADKIAAFRNEPGPAAMVIGIAVGGVAIDLSCADHAVFAELDWTPANVHQAVMRTFHPSRPQAVVFLVADIPVEMHLVQALGVRENFASSLGLGQAQIAQMVLGHGISYG